MTTGTARLVRVLGTRRALLALAAFAALCVVGVVVLTTTPRNGPANPGTPYPGAAAISDPATKDVTWSELTHVDRMRPLPQNAVNDRPPFYRTQPECQTDVGDSKPSPCVFGDRTASRTMVIVGDSKIVQWQSALSDLGRAEGWKLIQITKSACPFTAAEVTRKHHVWKDCHDWGRAALHEILKIRPDVVLTSHGRTSALPEGGTATTPPTHEAMARGMATYWRTLTAAGIHVVAVLDNPVPAVPAVYECVARHPHALDRCSFDESMGVERSGAPSALAAVASLGSVTTLDMRDLICPDQNRCAPVIGNVMVYRQGSHITRTYIDSMEPQLASRLYRATSGAFGAG
ncbi:MAG: SGNH hydrolase domain-containing protein [Marmoricola sp.]